jgi:glycerol-3-phosphate acyltransferase PlsY
MAKIVLIYPFAYLAGSVNFAIIFLKLAGKADPRLNFSGNAGTTNVYRQAGILWAAVVFLLDIGRAITVAFMANYFFKKHFASLGLFFSCSGQYLSLFSRFSRRQRSG